MAKTMKKFCNVRKGMEKNIAICAKLLSGHCNFTLQYVTIYLIYTIYKIYKVYIYIILYKVLIYSDIKFDETSFSFKLKKVK